MESKLRAAFATIDSLAELRRRYHLAALRAHPDKGGSSEVFGALKGAYEARRRVLAQKTEPVPPPPPPPPSPSPCVSADENPWSDMAGVELIDLDVRKAVAVLQRWTDDEGSEEDESPWPAEPEEEPWEGEGEVKDDTWDIEDEYDGKSWTDIVHGARTKVLFVPPRYARLFRSAQG